MAAPYYLSIHQPKSANGGSAFYDAQSLLAWRYAYNYNSLAIPPAILYNGLVLVGIDGYTVGNLMTNTSLPVTLAPPNGIITPWAGSDNPNRFFALPSDVFDTSKTAVGVVGTNFTQRLQRPATASPPTTATPITGCWTSSAPIPPPTTAG